jgi:hypothetical protein
MAAFMAVIPESALSSIAFAGGLECPILDTRYQLCNGTNESCGDGLHRCGGLFDRNVLGRETELHIVTCRMTGVRRTARWARSPCREHSI